MQYTKCNECPCHSSGEYGDLCGLGCDVEHTELFLNGWCDVSTNCGLRHVLGVTVKHGEEQAGMSFEPIVIHDMPKSHPVYHKYWESDIQRRLNKKLRQYWADSIISQPTSIYGQKI